METRIVDIWVYLAQTPLLWLTLTLAIYLVAERITQLGRSHPLLNTVLISIVLLVGLLLITRTSYETYFAGAQFIHFLLGPATVALAIPLYRAADKLRRLFVPLLISLVIGSSTAIVSVALIAQALGLSERTRLSLLPKSITTPIAMGISEQIGGIPSLTAVLVILTGITGGVIAKDLLDLLRIRDPSVRGVAIGLASHGIGTVRAFQLHPEAGAFSGLAMGLNGAITSVLVPVLVHVLGG